MTKVVFVGAALVSLWSAPLTRAVAIFSDSFNYPDGPLVNVSGGAWVHHSGTTTGEVQVVSGRAFLSQTNSEDVSAQLAGQPYSPSNNTVLYASFSINFRSLPAGSNGTYFAHFKDAAATVFRDKIFAFTNGAPSGSFRIGVANVDSAAPSAVLNDIFSTNTDYVLVMRYALTNATSTLWLNPGAESDQGITASDTAAPINIVAFALRESLSSGNGMGSFFFDNLVAGTSFGDVVSNVPPSIAMQPASQTVTEGSDVTLNVIAVGTPPLSYQWQFYGTNLTQGTNSSLVLNPITTNQAGPYVVLVTNAFGLTNSETAQLTVNPMPQTPPTILTQPASQTVTEGTHVTLAVTTDGSPPLSFQWQFYGTNVPDATNSTLDLFGVTTNQAGPYFVVVTNAFGTTNSDTAVLTVLPSTLPVLSVLTYNTKGNGAADWSTNAPQIQALGHEVMYFQPDIITFNEIPNSQTYQMTNFVSAFLPGFFLATNSSSDGFIRSVIASRFPILYSKSHLHSSNLDQYGYTNSNFTRDLFQAQISVPAFPQPLDVFVVHLKSGQDTDSSNKRAAEASAVSNFFVGTFLATNSTHPYYLAGDMNEDIDDPPASNPQSIQRLINPATGLQLTTPLNPFTGSRLTFSIQSTNGLSKRYDYIQPNGLLFSNINASQVFRSDLLPNPPPPLLSDDDRTASDHLPVLMQFANPYSQPFRVTSIQRSNQTVTLLWNSVPGQPYRVESSSNLVNWQVLASNLTAIAWSMSYTSSFPDALEFFRVSKTR